ncbi:hypothetical protein D3C85_1070470 [compost metagenome]
MHTTAKLAKKRPMRVKMEPNMEIMKAMAKKLMKTTISGNAITTITHQTTGGTIRTILVPRHFTPTSAGRAGI